MADPLFDMKTASAAGDHEKANHLALMIAAESLSDIEQRLEGIQAGIHDLIEAIKASGTP
jgi:hypothetical protein